MRFILAATPALALAVVTFALATAIAFAAEPVPAASPREVAAGVAKAIDGN